MHDNHYLWPLFTSDIEFARRTLQELWEQKKIGTNQAAHWALNLGHTEWVQWLVEESKKINDQHIHAEGIQFRLERLNGKKNPYELLCALTKEERYNVKQIGLKNCIELTGGIGDHIEDISILIPWLKNKTDKIRFKCTNQRKEQLQRLMPMNVWHTTEVQRKKSVNSKIFLAALEEELASPQKWINLRYDSDLREHKKLFCCWTAAGQGDKLSRWIRSIPFSEVISFYETAIEQGIVPASITDCSLWRPWEQKILENKGIESYKPENEDVLALAKRAQNHQQVISIDSALAHLCAAMNKRVELLLPKYCDERWYQLLRPGSSYQKCCSIRRQASYGTWKKEIKRLGEKIILESKYS